MGALVDLHIMRTYSPDDWYAEAVASVEGEPVNLHLVDGIPGRIGEARARAISRGSAPYVAWVDDDDRLMPGAVAAALDVLESDPLIASTYTDMAWMDPAGELLEVVEKPPWQPIRQLQHLLEVHHFHVYRRSAIQQALLHLDGCQGLEEWILATQSLRRYRQGRAYWRHHHIPGAWYHARRHTAYPRSGQTITRQLRLAALRAYGGILLALHRAGVRQPCDLGEDLPPPGAADRHQIGAATDRADASAGTVPPDRVDETRHQETEPEHQLNEKRARDSGASSASGPAASADGSTGLCSHENLQE